jgi:hypothetical protein
VQEPDSEDGGLAEAPVMEREAGSEARVAEPKAYAFDGWGMIPLELGAA